MFSNTDCLRNNVANKYNYYSVMYKHVRVISSLVLLFSPIHMTHTMISASELSACRMLFIVCDIVLMFTYKYQYTYEIIYIILAYVQYSDPRVFIVLDHYIPLGLDSIPVTCKKLSGFKWSLFTRKTMENQRMVSLLSILLCLAI